MTNSLKELLAEKEKLDAEITSARKKISSEALGKVCTNRFELCFIQPKTAAGGVIDQ
ncbi:hypothetical protein [Acidovorax sp. HMWF018]|uniref:hypothetical protein n=1 Tax=Acidovorax sp. HMWF018 TaxID=2056855 RepID=UPI001304AC6B|nr:hypothetical protein [Acidovorax sp. HMWF018]